MAFQKKFGGITIRKVEQKAGAPLEDRLSHRRLKVLESSSSQGLNHSILSAVSIGTNYAYLGVPWSQAINLSLEEARDVAHDTLMLHPDEERAVISLVEVAGQYKWMHREYYCVTPGTIWDLFGSRATLHSYVETHTREGISGNETQAQDSTRDSRGYSRRESSGGSGVVQRCEHEGGRLRKAPPKGRSGKDDGVPRKTRARRSDKRKDR